MMLSTLKQPRKGVEMPRLQDFRHVLRLPGLMIDLAMHMISEEKGGAHHEMHARILIHLPKGPQRRLKSTRKKHPMGIRFYILSDRFSMI